MNSEHKTNDTHGQHGLGWYGFDLDGTLATYNGWMGAEHIGEPIKPMVDIIKRYHDEGKVVKIMTARVAPRKLEDGSIGEQFVYVCQHETGKRYASDFIKEWCEKNLGFVPEIVHHKDALMLWLFDDRVVQVESNTGRILGKMPE